jgi:hypothetical protein
VDMPHAQGVKTALAGRSRLWSDAEKWIYVAE